jgi:hypothetical protein
MSHHGDVETMGGQIRQALSLSGALALEQGAKELGPALVSQPGCQVWAQAEAENLGLPPPAVITCRACAPGLV